MSSGRRRSARLIESPWVYNWQKKAPVFVNLESDSSNLFDRQTKMMNHEGTKQGGHAEQCGRGSARGSKSGVKTSSLNMRTERRIAKASNETELTDDDDDFVTLAEHFGKRHGGNALDAQEVALGSESVDKTSKKRKRETKGTKLHSDAERAEGSRREVVDKGVGKKGRSTAGFGAKRLIISKHPIRQKSKKASPSRIEKPEKGRSYEGYLERKFSPSIIRAICKNFTEEQANWVKSSGFGDLLDFDMKCYAHKLGYNLVQAFDVERCELVLKCGTIEINERLVHNVLGLPMGESVLTASGPEPNVDVWGEQFDRKAGCKISPLAVKTKLLESKVADRFFKLNFLVMFYNFFIEGHQNRYLNRDALRLDLNLDGCAQYNWCRLLIDKLQSSYTYWVAERKRSLTGSLPFLIVRNNKYAYVPPMFPSYKGWTDLLIKERQKKELAEGSFRVGEIVPLLREANAEHVKTSGAIEMCNDDQVVEDTEDSQANSDEERSVGTEMDGFEAFNDQEMVDNAMIEVTKEIAYPGSSTIPAGNGNIQILETERQSSARKEDLRPQPKELITEQQVNSMGKSTLNTRTTIAENNSMVSDTAAMENAGLLQSEKVLEKVSTASRPIFPHPPVSETLRLTGSRLVDPVEQGTQGGGEDVMDKHFREDKYMEELSRYLDNFQRAYDLCVNHSEVALALYPTNADLAKLREKHKQFFQMLEETSPLSKRLLGGTLKEKNKDVDDSSFVPSFSLGLSQVTPKNQGAVMDVVDNAGGQREVEANQLVARPRRGVRISEICRSPFVSRVLDISGHKITNDERIVWEWLFENRRNRWENLFEFHNAKCTKAHFQSLQTNCVVDRAVIDAWSYLLNANEALRAKTSPFRLFLTSETAYGPMKLKMDFTDPLWKIGHKVAFIKNMELAMETMNHLHNRVYDVKDFDMFIFPIYDSSHHYIISYNMKTPMWDIIDNRVPIGGFTGFKQMYGDLPYRLHECFCEWISVYNLPKESEIQKLGPRVVRVGWQTKANSVDSGIFVMRVMETYMGSLLGWTTGLRTENDNQKSLLNKLRVVYDHKILTWEQNSKREYVMGGAKYLARGKKIAE